jgi:hypothetical protein
MARRRDRLSPRACRRGCLEELGCDRCRSCPPASDAGGEARPDGGTRDGIHACPGAYTLLLGSGVSTAAGIPTGWQVVVDLVRRASAASTPDDEKAVQAAVADPEAWWVEHGDGEPLGYSNLLASLAATSAARQALLAGYFEPSEDDQEAGRKTATAAHKAIAGLVARGAVRVILTTNFDRLMERALEDVGISPQVIHTPEQVPAATPLAHSKVTVVKLHGDYLDLEQRNTVDELSTYPEAYDELLDRVFDEYGLVVSGWSAEWDHALVAALERRVTRRYPLFWGVYSTLSEPASRLVAQHQGAVISNVTADALFSGLVTRLEALDTLGAPALTRDMAVARLKRVLHDSTRRIEVADLVQSEADRIANHVADISRFPVNLPTIVYADIDASLASMRSESDTLLHLLATGIFHDDGTHDRVWLRAIERLMSARGRVDSWVNGLDEYRQYPALLAVWVAGVAAIAADREDFLARLLTEPKWRPWANDRTPRPVADVLRPIWLLDPDWLNNLPRWGQPKRYPYPASHLFRLEAREPLRALVPNDDDYTAACDRLECLASLVAVDVARSDMRAVPWMGEFVLDDRSDRDGKGLAAQVAAEIGEEWPMLSAFDGDVERAKEAAKKTDAFIEEYGRRW